MRHGDLNTDLMQLLPWGGKLTSESIKFFSPIVIWTKFTPSQEKYDVLYSALVDYYKVWEMIAFEYFVITTFVLCFSLFNLLAESFTIVLSYVFFLCLQAWLELVDGATEENDESRIIRNREAQHRYLAWRAEKVINIFFYQFWEIRIGLSNNHACMP